MGGWNDKELGRQYELKSAEHVDEMGKRVAAEMNVAKLVAAVRRARALTDHAIHGERDLAEMSDVHKALTDALLAVGEKL